MEFRRAYDPLRAIGGAWELGQRCPVTLWLGGLLLFLTDPSSPGGIRFEGGRAQWIGAWLLGVAFTVCFCIGVAVWVVGCLVHVGLAGAVRRLADGAKGSEVPVSELFRPRGLLPSMIVARLCKAVLLVLVALPFLVMYYGPYWLGSWVDVDIPGLVSTRVLGAIAGGLFSLAYLPIFGYVALGLALVEEVVAFDAKPPVEAITRSWELARGNRVTLLVFWIATAILYVSGAFLCLVGLLLTVPWCRVSWLEAYARFSGKDVSEPATTAG